MENIDIQITDGKIVLTIDSNQAGSLSASGKSRVIATTRGNVSIPGTDLKMGLNVYRPVKEGS